MAWCHEDLLTDNILNESKEAGYVGWEEKHEDRSPINSKTQKLSKKTTKNTIHNKNPAIIE